MPAEQKWLTMQEATKRSGFGAVFLKKLLGHMEGISEEEAIKRTDVHVDEIHKAQIYWQSLMNLQDAARYLGILRDQVKGLQNRSVLDTIKVTSSLRYLKREQVNRLLIGVLNLPETLEGRSVVPLKDFCREKGVGIARLIELWTCGDLEGQLCRGEGVGLQAIEVSWDALCGVERVELDRDLMLPEVARYLKISIISIRHLRDHGYLSELTKRNPDTNRIKSYISKDSVSKFEQNFVTLGQMAFRQRVTPIHLARALDRDYVQPVYCGKNLVRVYEINVIGSEVWYSIN